MYICVYGLKGGTLYFDGARVLIANLLIVAAVYGGWLICHLLPNNPS